MTSGPIFKSGASLSHTKTSRINLMQKLPPISLSSREMLPVQCDFTVHVFEDDCDAIQRIRKLKKIIKTETKRIERIEDLFTSYERRFEILVVELENAKRNLQII